MRCSGCGCDEANACEGGCFWVVQDLCSQCYLRAYLEQAIGDGLIRQAVAELDAIAGMALAIAQGRAEVPAAMLAGGGDEALPRLWRPGDPL